VVDDFVQEVEVCCDLNHPNLVALMGYATKPRLLIVQELLLGQVPHTHRSIRSLAAPPCRSVAACQSRVLLLACCLPGTTWLPLQACGAKDYRHATERTDTGRATMTY
jgi:hypothetical protein